MVTRSNESFPNCLETKRQIPCPVSSDSKTITIDVADDLPGAAQRLRNVRLWLHLDNVSIEDLLEVSLNGAILECGNPMEPDGYDPTSDKWFFYDLKDCLPVHGTNNFGVRMASRNERLVQDGIVVQLSDMELWIEYEYPNGRWIRPRGYSPRT